MDRRRRPRVHGADPARGRTRTLPRTHRSRHVRACASSRRRARSRGVARCARRRDRRRSRTGCFFTRPQHTCSVYLVWADGPWSFDPRFGAPLPPVPGSLVDVPRVAGSGVLVADPAAALARLQELWPAAVLTWEPDTGPTRPAATLSVEDGMVALYHRPRDASELERLCGPGIFRPRLHLMALRVRDLEATAQTLEAEDIRGIRGDAASGELVTHLEDAHGTPVTWIGCDLPVDPRGHSARSPAEKGLFRQVRSRRRCPGTQGTRPASGLPPSHSSRSGSPSLPGRSVSLHEFRAEPHPRSNARPRLSCSDSSVFHNSDHAAMLGYSPSRLPEKGPLDSAHGSNRRSAAN